jgi:hypothetical protein
MRFLVKATWDTEAGNRLAKEGRLGSTIQSIIEDIKPEAVYFTADHGKRTGYFFVNMQDASQMPAIAEPLFLTGNATVEFLPVMLPEDLGKAGPSIEKAAKKYG